LEMSKEFLLLYPHRQIGSNSTSEISSELS
jgi:hypothetical protein